jgi:hypothetical protein
MVKIVTKITQKITPLAFLGVFPKKNSHRHVNFSQLQFYAKSGPGGCCHAWHRIPASVSFPLCKQMS